jgi:hypothetical protein
MKIMRIDQYKRRIALTLGTLGIAGSLGACNDMLQVTNPGSVYEESLNDPAFKTELVNSVVGEFNRMYTYMAYWGAILSDEAVTGHNYWQIQAFDLRRFDRYNSQLAEVYNPVQRSRALGEDAIARLRQKIGTASADQVGLARALAYTGYSTLVLGEAFCEAPVEEKGAALTSEQIATRAVELFDEAIKVTGEVKVKAAADLAAAKTKADSTAANTAKASADTLVNLARVGAARASLFLNKKAEAVAYAKDVPATYVKWVIHGSDASKTFMYNNFYSATTGSTPNLGVDTTFRGLNDKRIRYNPTAVKAHFASTTIKLPYQSSAFDGWSKDGADATFKQATKTRLASGLEARYILAEAGGMSDLELLDFINERRDVGGQAKLLTAIGVDLKAELRDQRRRDFYLDGHRLGDLRRYIATEVGNFFPKGQHPTAEWGQYGDQTCYIPYYTEWINKPEYAPKK